MSVETSIAAVAAGLVALRMWRVARQNRITREANRLIDQMGRVADDCLRTVRKIKRGMPDDGCRDD